MIRYFKLKSQLKKSNSLFAIMVLLIAAQLSNAQVPGYMGQRILVGGYLSFAPAISNLNANMKQGISAFNLRKTIEAEYVISRKVAIGAHYDFMSLGSNYEGADATESEDKDYQFILSQAPGIQIKLFKTKKKGALAPLGNYLAWNCSLVNYKVWNFKKGDYKTITRKVYESDVSKFLFGVEWGNNKILFDRIVFRTGVQLSLLTGVNQSPGSTYLQAQQSAYFIGISLGTSLLVPYRQKVN